ncbi:hypothetical protein [Actinomadura sp. WMMB 499]|uniref:phage tail tube protein n=1 Tax=Actinomadura sp. WMMB 499 TaxID=1219491 RepID=UPI001247F209|nr:hypothetical protein [Actinomadura sp. WMMB 499]QFG25447.1 hypothetical protein F7P10_34085 [Actinomadura sp. WMMB 499]
MADAPVLPSTGYVYVADVGTAIPALPIADPKAPGATWVSVGNTSLENGISRETDGDEPAVLGSWQNPSLKTTRPTKTRSLTINLLDFTVDAYALYYGGGVIVGPDGVTPALPEDTVKAFQIPAVSVPQEKALLIIAVDGEYQVVEHYGKASLTGGDAIEYDPAALAEIPVVATMLSADGTDYTGTISERLNYVA